MSKGIIIEGVSHVGKRKLHTPIDCASKFPCDLMRTFEFYCGTIENGKPLIMTSIEMIPHVLFQLNGKRVRITIEKLD
jgi:hypothetical protein